MFRIIFKFLTIAVISFLSACGTTKVLPETGSDTTGNLIIYYDPDAGNSELLKAAEKYGSRVIYVYQNINGIAVTVPKSKSVQDAVNYYGKIRGVLSVTEDRVMHLD